MVGYWDVAVIPRVFNVVALCVSVAYVAKVGVPVSVAVEESRSTWRGGPRVAYAGFEGVVHRGPPVSGDGWHHGRVSGDGRYEVRRIPVLSSFLGDISVCTSVKFYVMGL